MNNENTFENFNKGTLKLPDREIKFENIKNHVFVISCVFPLSYVDSETLL